MSAAISNYEGSLPDIAQLQISRVDSSFELTSSTSNHIADPEIGKPCFDIWESLQWQGFLLDELEYFHTCELLFPDGEAVLQLTVADSIPVLVAGLLLLEGLSGF